MLADETCPTLQRLTALLLRYALNPYKDLRNRAGQAIDGVMRRYPALVPAVMPAVLRALAGLPDAAGERAAGTNCDTYWPARYIVLSCAASLHLLRMHTQLTCNVPDPM